MNAAQKKNLTRWDAKTVVTIAIGAGLYGVLMVYGGIPLFEATNLTVAMIVPVFVGAVSGPIPAAICCGIGNVIADLIGGWGMNFDWSIGNAVLGLFVGALPLYGARIMDGVFRLKHMVIYGALCVIGNIVAFGVVTPVFSSILYARPLKLSLTYSLFSCIGNILVLLVVGIPVLIMLTKRYAARANLMEDDGGIDAE